jgi:citrate lyase subunit beta / citryl-CoA lyase
MRIRSYLYAPGNRPELMAKAARSGAHAVILDLEDAVPAAEKSGACVTVRAFLEAEPAIPAFVRLNSGRAALQDLARIGVRGLSGVLVPKAEDPALIGEIDRALSESEARDGLDGGGAIIQPLIESVAGLYGLDALAQASPRIRRVAFGAGDYVRDIRAQATEPRTETLYARMYLVARSRFLRLEAPVAHVFSRVRDLEGLRRACAEDRALGFQARSCIHPTQVAVINAAFAPTQDELAQARRILAAYSEATAAGRGSLLLEDGTFIDEAAALRAQDVVSSVP